MLALVGGLAVAAGTFLPWFRFQGATDIGINYSEGVLALIAGIVVVGLAIASLVLGWRWLKPLLLLASLGSLVLIIFVVVDIIQAANAWQANPVEFSGIGIAVVLIGALVATGTSAASLRLRRR